MTAEILKNPEQFKNEYKTDLDERFSNYQFLIPEYINTNKNRLNYKVNFVIDVYQIVYPDMKRTKIYHHLNKDFHIFLSERQIQRIVKEKIKFD